MKRVFLYILVLTAVLLQVSCRRTVEKARQNIRVEAVERVGLTGLSSAELVLRVKNGMGYKLVLKNARLEVCYAGREVVTVRLHEGVEVARHTTQSVATRWQVRVSDPLAMYVLAQKIRRGETSQIAVSYDVEGRGGPAKVNISRQMVPLSEFLSTFGLTLQDVENYLK